MADTLSVVNITASPYDYTSALLLNQLRYSPRGAYSVSDYAWNTLAQQPNWVAVSPLPAPKPLPPPAEPYLDTLPPDPELPTVDVVGTRDAKFEQFQDLADAYGGGDAAYEQAWRETYPDEPDPEEGYVAPPFRVPTPMPTATPTPVRTTPPIRYRPPTPTAPGKTGGVAATLNPLLLGLAALLKLRPAGPRELDEAPNVDRTVLRPGDGIPDARGLPVFDPELPEVTVRPIPTRIPAPAYPSVGPSDFPFTLAPPGFEVGPQPGIGTQPRVKPSPNAPGWTYAPPEPVEIDFGFDVIDLPLNPGTWMPDFATPDIGQPTRSTPPVPNVPRTTISPPRPISDFPDLLAQPPRVVDPVLDPFEDPLADPNPFFTDPLADPVALMPPNQAGGCNCGGSETKERKPRKDRAICYEGKYREYSRGTSKFSKREVPCEPQPKIVKAKAPPKGKKKKAPRTPTFRDLAIDVLGTFL